MSVTVDQSGLKAGGDVVARDKISNTHHHHYASNERQPTTTHFEALLSKLHDELALNAQATQTIDELQFFFKKISPDGVVGLSAKLTHAGRQYELPVAIEKKELFAKQLEKWSLYGSAQQILAYLLAKIEYIFSTDILPQLETLTAAELNHIVTQKIVIPIVDECGADIFAMNHAVVMGMVYWLAEQCFVRWHP